MHPTDSPRGPAHARPRSMTTPATRWHSHARTSRPVAAPPLMMHCRRTRDARRPAHSADSLACCSMVKSLQGHYCIPGDHHKNPHARVHICCTRCSLNKKGQFAGKFVLAHPVACQHAKCLLVDGPAVSECALQQTCDIDCCLSRPAWLERWRCHGRELHIEAHSTLIRSA